MSPEIATFLGLNSKCHMSIFSTKRALKSGLARVSYVTSLVGGEHITRGNPIDILCIDQ